jgi:hypothetical protein
MTLSFTTVTGNTAGSQFGPKYLGFGGGIATKYGSSTLYNSIVAGNNVNSTYGGGADLYTFSNSQVYAAFSLVGNVDNSPTLIDLDPRGSLITGVGVGLVLDPLLRDNGGPTKTHALIPGSPAIDAGNPAFAGIPQIDQRGFLRKSGDRVDMGAFEANSSAAGGDVLQDVGLGAIPAGLADGHTGAMSWLGSLLLGLGGLWRRIRRRR